jgi:hypothetical protein
LEIIRSLMMVSGYEYGSRHRTVQPEHDAHLRPSYGPVVLVARSCIGRLSKTGSSERGGQQSLRKDSRDANHDASADVHAVLTLSAW